MSIEIDCTNMVGIDAEQSRFDEAFKGVKKLRASGEIGFIDVTSDVQLLDQSIQFAKKAQGQYDHIVVLGIGGSALGPIALRTALAQRKGYPQLHVLDNIDPVTMSSLLDEIKLERTLFIVTSKSGSTAETMSQYLIIDDRLNNKNLDPKKHFVFITDPKKGALRQIADKHAIPALDIPTNIGGRFSVLTPVGVLPAALIGIDVTQLLSGAQDMTQRCSTSNLKENIAGMFAMLQWTAHEKHGKNIHVLMPYADQLRDLSAWFVQLWAESLGKVRLGVEGFFEDSATSVRSSKNPSTPSCGPTPISALGATDQHSQVQLFMEGPNDKTITFISIKNRPADIKIPKSFPDIEELSYLGGHALGELLDAEQKATASALAKAGRPNMTIQLDSVDPWHLGALMMLLELATAYAGQLYGVNAFDQPGVELGKKIAYALLGRPGFNTLTI